MTARQWLGRARTIDREIKTLEAAQFEARARLKRMTQNYESDGAQSTKDPHKFDALAEYIGLLEQKRSALFQTQSEITDAIYKIDDGRQRAVLMSYYVRCQTLEKIAVDESYSYRHVKRLLRAGEDAVNRWVNADFEKMAPHVP